MFVCGIDAGATQTLCLVADRDGRIAGVGRGGAANPHAVGEQEVERVLRQTIGQAMGPGASLDAICLGVAGVDRVQDAEPIYALVRRIVPSARALVVNDALIALTAGVGDAPGVVIVAGTGSMAYGRDAAGRAARAGGWGHLLGDEGSGYWMGRMALRAVVRAADGRGPATRLTSLVLRHYGVTDTGELIQRVYRDRPQPRHVAELAHLVVAARTEAEDAVAAEIVDRAAAELASAASAVVRRLDLAGHRFTFVLSGGVFRGSSAFVDALAVPLRRVAPRGTAVRLEREPAEGALHLALAQIRGGARLPVYLTP